jgi:hypothetical protein
MITRNLLDRFNVSLEFIEREYRNIAIRYKELTGEGLELVSFKLVSDVDGVKTYQGTFKEKK